MRFPKEEFEHLRNELNAKDTAREQVIQQSRGLLKDAKRAIYEAHSGNIVQSQALIEKVAQAHSTIKQHFTDFDILSVGAYTAALEEYAEAACFIAFICGDPLPSCTKLAVPPEQYLAGLSDMTGELARRAVFAVIGREHDVVHDIWDFVNTLQGELLHFHLRNSLLRKKFDTVKYNLQKIEQSLYDLELRSNQNSTQSD